ncbi:unnamed protein product [Caenorhabditis sp. 36 PRJEB53466]|nr:unnamed protein product [Caenorhabditis sp. 36 PRJEB53466]
MTMRIGAWEFTICHVALVAGIFAISLMTTFVLKCISMGVFTIRPTSPTLFHRKEPTKFRQFERIAGLSSIRHPNFTVFCSPANCESVPGSSVRHQDRRAVESVLRHLLNEPVVLPDTAVAVSIPALFSTCGREFHQFHCKPPVPEWTSATITSENRYSFRMFAGQIQATYHNDRRSHFLAGICVYLRIPGAPWHFRGLSAPFIIELLRGGSVRKMAPMRASRMNCGGPPATHFIVDLSDSDSAQEDDPPPPPYFTLIDNDPPPPNYFSLFTSTFR